MIVVDSAVLVDALVLGPDGRHLRARLAGEDLHAPQLVDCEVVSALQGLVLGDRLSDARAGDALTDFDDLPIHRWPFADGLRRRAFHLRDQLSAYDAAYVVVSESLLCPLVTRDARVARSSNHGARIEVL